MLLLYHFSLAISYAGLLLDLAAPIILFCCSHSTTRGATIARLMAACSCLVFNACNKLWFGLGVFPWLNGLAIVTLFMAPMASSSSSSPPPPPSAATSPPPSPRRWARRLLTLLAVPHMLIPLRHLVLFQGSKSSLWTDEGHLYAWHMKLVERKGSLVLTVQTAGAAPHHEEEAATPRTFHLVPETDTALHPDQAGELAHNPTMLLQYASFLREAFALRGYANASISATSSCVAVNGRPAQPLYLPHANLPDHLQEYTSLTADLTGYSGVGRFLVPWAYASPSLVTRLLGGGSGNLAAVAAGAVPCDVEAPPPESLQRESDHNYRWLYRPLFFSRPAKADWPFSPTLGWRSRLPEEAGSCSTEEEEEAPPAWATACSFVHAAGAHGGIWCPDDAPTDQSN